MIGQRFRTRAGVGDLGRSGPSVLGVATSPAQEELPSCEELWKIIQQRQREIDEFKKPQAKADENVDATGVYGWARNGR